MNNRILRRILIFNIKHLNWKVRKIKIKEPFISDILELENEIETGWDMFKAVNKIIPITRKEFKISWQTILKWLLKLIVKDNSSKKTVGNSSSKNILLISALDRICERYWAYLPNEIIYKITFTQLASMFNAIEYNYNIDNDKEDKNAKFTVWNIDVDRVIKKIENNSTPMKFTI